MKKLIWIAVIIAAVWFVSNRFGFNFSSFIKSMENTITKPAPAPAPAATPANRVTPAPASTPAPARTPAPAASSTAAQKANEAAQSESDGKRSGVSSQTELPGGANMQRLVDTFQATREE